MKYIKFILAIAVVFLPWPIKKYIYKTLFNFDFKKGARIGFSIIYVDRLIMIEDSYIGHFNIIRNLELLHIGKNSLIGSFNWIFGMGQSAKSHFHSSRHSKLILCDESAITARHIIDCIDSVSIGKFSILAGHRSQVLSHAINLTKNVQESEPITIGDYCFIGTGSIILKGSNIPDYSIVGAGSVFTKRSSIDKSSYNLYAGNPAKISKPLDKDLNFFTRKSGFVD